MYSTNRIVQSLTYFLQGLSVRPSQSGMCYSCERVTEWQARLGFYRCQHCAQDPLEHKPDGELA